MIGVATFPGDAHDALTLPQDGALRGLLGGIGSALDYTGAGTRYIAVPDRPGSHTSYIARFDLLELRFATGVAAQSKLLVTQALRDAHGLPLQAATNADGGRRFDPEAVRVSGTGTFYVAEEYGPSVVEFDDHGRWLRELPVPAKFASTDASTPSGRQANAGFEGLALSPDGAHLFALMQKPLLQDHGLDAQGQPHGTYCRLLDIELATGKTRELVYALDNRKHGLNELVAVNDHALLVIERDWEGDLPGAFKRVFSIDLAGASDVTQVSSLHAKKLPADVKAVVKTPLLDLRAREFGLQHDACMTKIESLAFGPDLPDGRHVLIVGCDNDYEPQVPSKFVAFAFSHATLAYEPLVLRPRLQVTPAAHGGIRVAVLSTALLDMTSIDRDTIALLGGGQALSISAPDWTAVDVDGDGVLDLTATARGTLQPMAAVELRARTARGHSVESRAQLPGN